jgi:hypothetical protein
VKADGLLKKALLAAISVALFLVAVPFGTSAASVAGQGQFCTESNHFEVGGC